MCAVLQVYICTLFVCLTGSIYFGFPEKTWTDGAKSCLLSPKDDIDNQGTDSISSSFVWNISSAWTGTRVKFSKWSAFIGCSTGITSKYYKSSGNKLSVKECLMACSDIPAFTHFAIQDTECCCIFHLPGPLAITDTCRETCVNYNESFCSSGKSSMVFTLVKEVNATAETNTLLEDECLTSYHHSGMTFPDYKVHDCNDEFIFACSNTSCKYHCTEWTVECLWYPAVQFKLIRTDQPSCRSWYRYQESCHDQGHSVLFEKGYVGSVAQEGRYWTPMFRTFRYITKGTPSSGEFCLALSTEGDYILKNCSAVYPFLCLDTGQYNDEYNKQSPASTFFKLQYIVMIVSGVSMIVILPTLLFIAVSECKVIKSYKEKLKNLNQTRELNESRYIGLEDRNHEEIGYREIVTSDSNPNIANADVNYHVPCTQPEILHTAPVDTEGYLVPELHHEIIPILSN